jgi:hypothetical protein
MTCHKVDEGEKGKKREKTWAICASTPLYYIEATESYQDELQMKGGPIARLRDLFSWEKLSRWLGDKRAKHYTGKPKLLDFTNWRPTKDIGTFARVAFSRTGQKKKW